MKSIFPNTYISASDKVTPAKFENNISSYPINTYIKLCTRGNINDLSQYTYSKVKVADNKWQSFSSLRGYSDRFSTDKDILNLIYREDIKNIGVKFPK